MSFKMTRRDGAELLFNRVVTHIPSNHLRIWSLRALGAELGPQVYFFGGTEILAPQNLRVNGNCHIGRHCQIDARGGISLGTNVVIASFAVLVSADHDINDAQFPGRVAPITIEDRVWLATRVTVVKGVTVGEGAVAAAGSVVTRDVPPWAIVAGVPARVVGERSPDQQYQIDDGPAFY